nr:reverse transcriptase [Chroomonas debatzensis]
MENNLSDISWSILPWREFRDKLFRIQSKIYKVNREGNFKKLYSLQKLLIKSQTTHYIAIRDISYLTYGLKLNLSPLTSEEKFNLSLKLKDEMSTWRYDPEKSITIKDLIILYIWKLALEPIYENPFFQQSHKFRFNQRLWNFQYKILTSLKVNKQLEKKIILLDLSDSFSSINYKILLQRLHFPNPYKLRLFKALKKGFLTVSSTLDKHPHSESFMLSSLLKNLIFKNTERMPANTYPHQICNFLLGIRYKSSVLYILDTNMDSRKLLDMVRIQLKTNGGDFISSTVSITSSLNGFEFLDWYFRVTKEGRVFSYPNKSNLKKQKQKVQALLKNSNYTLESRLYKLKFIIRVWYRYNKLCDLSQIKAYLYYLKLWIIKYLKKSSSLSKEKRLIYLKKIFEA